MEVNDLSMSISETLLGTAILFLFLSCSSYQENNLVRLILKNENDSLINRVLENRDKYKLQIVYTRIFRDNGQVPHFKTYTLGLDEEEYFYPASTVKLPVALLTLEKINQINIQGLDKSTPMLTDSIYPWQTSALVDSTARNNLPSIEHYIKKILLVSDNDAFNRLYEFLGPNYINNKLRDKGYHSARIIHRLSVPLSSENNKITNPVRFVNDSKLVYRKLSQKDEEDFTSSDKILLGKGEIINGSLVQKPKDFSVKNELSLLDMHEMMKTVFFPDAVDSEKTFQLDNSDYKFIYKYMALLPRESDYPDYDKDQYYDSYVKFLMFGDSMERIPEHIRIFNKVGDAYGFLIDHAYIVDFKNKIEFLLSAVIYVNENQIFNDDNYQYEEIGLPFLAKTGKVIYNYELQEEKEVSPDLSHLKAIHSNL